MKTSNVIWITGFSGSGKTTIARLLQKRLEEQQVKVILLDGDEMRDAMGFTANYSLEERKKIAYIYAKFAKLIADQSFHVIVSTISMFEDVREWNRKNNKNYLEIYLKVSKKERVTRDSKKFYFLGSREAIVENNKFYKEPKNPDMTFNSKDKLSPKQIVRKILKRLRL